MPPSAMTFEMPTRIPMAAGDATNGTSGSALTLTYASAGAGMAHVIMGVTVAYLADPTNGLLTIKDGSATIFEVPITSKGPAQFIIPIPKKGSAATALTITLADGGTTKYINVDNHWTEPSGAV